MARPRLNYSEAMATLTADQARARAKIQTSAIITRVAALMEDTKIEPARAQMQIAAAKLLLAKALPDLSSVEMTGTAGGPLTITINKL